MIQLTAELLRKCMPRCPSPENWAPPLQRAMDEFGISANKERVVRFLAQIAVESDELTRLEENLNYSPERLMEVWPKRFPTRVIAEKYARSPHGLANYVYANRMGNGDEASGDGWKNRGRGPKQITGAKNYAACSKALSDPLIIPCPDRLLTKETGARAAAWFWQASGLNGLADDLPNDDQEADFVTITHRVNGGENGLKRRQAYLTKFEAAFA